MSHSTPTKSKKSVSESRFGSMRSAMSSGRSFAKITQQSGPLPTEFSREQRRKLIKRHNREKMQKIRQMFNKIVDIEGQWDRYEKR